MSKDTPRQILEAELEAQFERIMKHFGPLTPQSTDRKETIGRVSVVPTGVDKTPAFAHGIRMADENMLHVDSPHGYRGRCDVLGMLLVRRARRGGESWICPAGAIHEALRVRDPQSYELLTTKAVRFRISGPWQADWGPRPNPEREVKILWFNREGQAYIRNLRLPTPDHAEPNDDEHAWRRRRRRCRRHWWH